jgi:catechol 2,3-dioxygenase-like lactoylglutathione lyase family enzyme
MKRFHVHVAVPDLAESIGFYSTLFGAEPAVRKHDYAKWMLDDPRINFAISQRGGSAGVDHLGFQVDSEADLQAAHEQLAAAGRAVTAEKEAHCCYAVSDKYWVTDPSGVAWETFHTLDSIPLYGSEAETNACGTGESACCGSKASTESTPATDSSRRTAQGGCCGAASAAIEKARCCA